MINFSKLGSILLCITLTGVLPRLVNSFLPSLPLVIKPLQLPEFQNKQNEYKRMTGRVNVLSVQFLNKLNKKGIATINQQVLRKHVENSEPALS